MPQHRNEHRRPFDADSAQDISRLVRTSYPDLRRLAERHLSGEKLGAESESDLVQEMVIRLLGQQKAFADRAHFLAVANIIAVRVIRDLNRRHKARKRNPGSPPVPLELEPIATLADRLDAESLSRLADALEDLRRVLPRTAEVIALRYLHDMPTAQVARHLDLSAGTVYGECEFGKAWLLERLDERSGPAE